MTSLARYSRLAWALGGLCLIGTGCGDPTRILVHVTALCAGSPCGIPAEVDRIQLQVIEAVPAAGQTAQEVGREDVTLTADKSFPVTFLLEPSETTPAQLRQVVLVYSGTIELGTAALEHEWKAETTNEVSIEVAATP